MKPLSIISILVLGLLFGSKGTAAAVPISPATQNWMMHQPYLQSFMMSASSSTRSLSYYWYTPWPLDSYVDYNTVAGEEWNLWLGLGGVIVNTNSMGGTLLEEGFIDSAYPHDQWASVFLYGHFVA